jgi:hypothetical protein
MSFNAVPVVTLLGRNLHKPWGKSVCKDTEVSQFLLVIILIHKPSRVMLIDFVLPGHRKVQVGYKYLNYIVSTGVTLVNIGCITSTIHKLLTDVLCED